MKPQSNLHPKFLTNHKLQYQSLERSIDSIELINYLKKSEFRREKNRLGLVFVSKQSQVKSKNALETLLKSQTCFCNFTPLCHWYCYIKDSITTSSCRSMRLNQIFFNHCILQKKVFFLKKLSLNFKVSWTWHSLKIVLRKK